MPKTSGSGASLLLLSKTLVDWLTESRADFNFLPVCSDTSVTKRLMTLLKSLLQSSDTDRLLTEKK